MAKKALIIGHSGQDGYYLTAYLESLNYRVFGVSSSENYGLDGLQIPSGTVTDFNYCAALFSQTLPDEVYYFAALHQSSVEQSFDDLSFYKQTIDTNANGFLNFLACVLQYKKECKIFYASSSHIFGGTSSKEQDEQTPYCPVSIYGVSKVLGMQYADLYRQKGVHCSVGIFYNHESPLRSSKFVSKKIIETAVRIAKGEATELILGDLNAQIDWGFAPDYVRAAHASLQIENSGNFIVSSGTLHTIENFVQLAFDRLDLNWRDYVKVNAQIIQKKSVTILKGNNQKILEQTHWKPSVSFREMVELMVESQIKL